MRALQEVSPVDLLDDKIKSKEDVVIIWGVYTLKNKKLFSNRTVTFDVVWINWIKKMLALMENYLLMKKSIADNENVLTCVIRTQLRRISYRSQLIKKHIRWGRLKEDVKGESIKKNTKWFCCCRKERKYPWRNLKAVSAVLGWIKIRVRYGYVVPTVVGMIKRSYWYNWHSKAIKESYRIYRW